MRLLVFLMVVASGGVWAQSEPRSVGKDLMVKALPDIAGKEAVVRANVYPPGTSNPPHRHDAHVFLHVLEGQLIVQLKGGQPVNYVVELAAAYQSAGVVGRRVAEAAYLPGDPVLVHVSPPGRLAWSLRGLDSDGWFVKGDPPVRLRTYGRQCAAFTALPGPPAASRLTLRFPNGRVRHVTLPPGGYRNLRTPVPGTTVITAQGDGTVPRVFVNGKYYTAPEFAFT